MPILKTNLVVLMLVPVVLVVIILVQILEPILKMLMLVVLEIQILMLHKIIKNHLSLHTHLPRNMARIQKRGQIATPTSYPFSQPRFT